MASFAGASYFALAAALILDRVLIVAWLVFRAISYVHILMPFKSSSHYGSYTVTMFLEYTNNLSSESQILVIFTIVTTLRGLC